MPEIVFIVPARKTDVLHRILSMLSFQKDRGFRAVVADFTGDVDLASVVAEFESRIPVSCVPLGAAGEVLWKTCLDAVPTAEWICFLGSDVDFSANSVRRMRRCISDHPGYDVFHWNLEEPFRKYCLKTKPGKLFRKVFRDGAEAPLSSFVFRGQALREALAADTEAAAMDLAVLLSAAKKTGIRTVRWERIGYRKPDTVTDPSLIEKEVRERLMFFRWSERFFGDDYPLGVGERLDLFASELVRLYPSYTPDDLKDDLNTFAVVNGPVRKMRASSALKAALKVRRDSLK